MPETCWFFGSFPFIDTADAGSVKGVIAEAECMLALTSVATVVMVFIALLT